jgi:hypothetical protein
VKHLPVNELVHGDLLLTSVGNWNSSIYCMYMPSAYEVFECISYVVAQCGSVFCLFVYSLRRLVIALMIFPCLLTSMYHQHVQKSLITCDCLSAACIRMQ